MPREIIKAKDDRQIERMVEEYGIEGVLSAIESSARSNVVKLIEDMRSGIYHGDEIPKRQKLIDRWCRAIKILEDIRCKIDI